MKHDPSLTIESMKSFLSTISIAGKALVALLTIIFVVGGVLTLLGACAAYVAKIYVWIFNLL